MKSLLTLIMMHFFKTKLTAEDWSSRTPGYTISSPDGEWHDNKKGACVG